MRRWITVASLLVAPLLSGCCCYPGGCGYRLFCRPCMFGPCGQRGCCGDFGGPAYSGFAGPVGEPGCSSCYGGGAPPLNTVPPPPVTGPTMTAPPIDKLTAVPPPAQTVPTRIIR